MYKKKQTNKQAKVKYFPEFLNSLNLLPELQMKTKCVKCIYNIKKNNNKLSNIKVSYVFHIN